MPIVHLVRHGRAAAGFEGHLDPGLDAVGRSQAEAAAVALAQEFKTPVPIYTSPLARARETAAPLAERWGVTPIIEPRVGEILAPTTDLHERARWLRGVMVGPWTALSPDVLAWRQALVDCVAAFATDVTVFCHFIAINVAVGAALGDDRLIVFRPDNGSITKIAANNGKLELVALGSEAQTRVN